MARSSRLRVCLATVTRNSSQTHWHRSTSRQRTTPWMAGVGPLSITAASAARWAPFNRGGWPGALRSTRPSGPSALNRSPLDAVRPTPHDLQRHPADPGVEGSAFNRSASPPHRQRPAPASGACGSFVFRATDRRPAALKSARSGIGMADLHPPPPRIRPRQPGEAPNESASQLDFGHSSCVAERVGDAFAEGRAEFCGLGRMLGREQTLLGPDLAPHCGEGVGEGRVPFVVPGRGRDAQACTAAQSGGEQGHDRE
jgi:hypothetical protein